MISPGRGLRLGVREEEEMEGGAKYEKERTEESNSLALLFLLGVIVEREGREIAGEGLVAELRTEENDESRILSCFCFGVTEVDMLAGRRISVGADIPVLVIFPVLPAGVDFL